MHVRVNSPLMGICTICAWWTLKQMGLFQQSAPSNTSSHQTDVNFLFPLNEVFGYKYCWEMVMGNRNVSLFCPAYDPFRHTPSLRLLLIFIKPCAFYETLWMYLCRKERQILKNAFSHSLCYAKYTSKQTCHLLSTYDLLLFSFPPVR